MKFTRERIILLIIFISILSIVIFFTFNKEKQIAFVINVIDGDTIEIETGEKVRLLGINAPENGDKYYEKAKEELKYLVLNKYVLLEKIKDNKDKYGRLLRIIFLNNTNVNKEMIKNGLALPYILNSNFKYTFDFENAFKDCIKENIGLCEKSENPCKNCIKILKINAIEKNSLNDEYVEIKNLCNFSCNISKWKIHDSAWNTFIFNHSLESNSSLILYTGYGYNTKNIFYWNSGFPIWNNNYDIVYLRDEKGKLVDYFIIK
ncbi:MAG: thermonuclease family protein [Candidatus Aenigmatarchaeota archaeon]|nr:thermonuclease family protein [Candidatus Aenigmarchaeota archaeon]